MFANQGLYNFSGVVVIVQPGSEFKLGIEFIGVQTFGNTVNFTKYATNISVSARECVVGEEYTQDGRCSWCKSGSYSLDAPKSF